MSLSKSKGNMYPWVTHMHTHLAGECTNRCSYCYVQTGPARWSGKYQGPLRLIESELVVPYGHGKTIFIEHMNDLFAGAVPSFWISKVLGHVCSWPQNTYVFQTKNPCRAYADFLRETPRNIIVGTTIETNRDMSEISKAPAPYDRAVGIGNFAIEGAKTFITIEPILDFDPTEFADLIRLAGPSFVNLGADSKGTGLVEPSWEKVAELIKRLSGAGIEIREKHNLDRLKARP